MKDDNLFSETSMSIGDHLDELRRCLVHSLYWIVIGLIGGFALAAQVVEYIQIPVTQSLAKYYSQRAIQKLEADSEQLRLEGLPPEIVSMPIRQKMMPVELYLYPGELERVLDRQKNQRRLSAGEDVDESILPTEVDNLLTRKKQIEKKRSELLGGLFAYGNTVHFDESPIRILFFKKIEDDPMTRTRALGVYEAFGIYIKAALVISVVLASPFIAYNLWSFVAAGLYPHEKKYIYYFIPVSIILFVGGALFAFFVVFQFVLDFLFGFNAWMKIDPDPRISEWIGFALMLPVGFGASFQLPLVMFVLERVGIFSLHQYLSSWRISVLAIFVLALFLTPGDPGSMLLMAVPLTVLYFGGVFFCWLIPRKKGLFDLDDETSDQE
ncbi:MAG: twin-arginine translocase subunit TatC [Thermoguttaceae bacterium]